MKSAGIPNPMILSVGSWAFSAVHGESVRILDVESVWSHTVYQVWIPRLDKEWGHDGYRQLLYHHAFRARPGRAVEAGQARRSEAWTWSGSATFSPVFTANRSCLASMPPIAFDHEPELGRDDRR
jgi:hypothetical protein